MALPIFCDEAIYLRYAQLIRRAPLANAFVSLVDPKPPLHYWLLAAVTGWTFDPLLAGRLLSVAAGLVSLLVLIPLCGELRVLAGQRKDEAGPRLDAFTLAACLLFLICPFLAFYQRMSLAESLLVAETLFVAWLGLGLARDPSRGGLSLGVAMGAALLTKQDFSYMLAALPIVAAAMTWRDLDRRRRRWLAGRLALAFVLAVVLFSPVLFMDEGPNLRDRLFFHPTHGAFGGDLAGRAGLIARNLRYVFVPGVVRETAPDTLYEGFHAPADAGWLWIYLTPPVYLLALAGFVRLAVRRRLRLLTYLGLWSALMLLPFVGFGRNAVPRYALFAVPPLLLAAASLVGAAAARARPPARSLVLTAVLLAVLAWPARSILLQALDAARQPLTRSDQWQYVSGWPAGVASMRAVEAIGAMAARGPVIVVTSHVVGTPDDVLWTYLDGRPNVRLYFVTWALRSPILRPAGGPDTFLFLTGFHGIAPAGKRVTVRPGVPILYVGMDPYPSPLGGIPAADSVGRLNPDMEEVARFENPPAPGIAHRDAIVIDHLR